MARSLPELGLAHKNGGFCGGLSKRCPPAGGAVGSDTSAENSQVKLLRAGGWRGVSEESHVQEVARHLEWAREMKASYERQVWAYEEELRRHNQRNARREELATETPKSQNEIGRVSNSHANGNLPEQHRSEASSQPRHRKAVLARRSKVRQHQRSLDARGSPTSLNLVFRPAERSFKGGGELLLRQQDEPQLIISHLLRVKSRHSASDDASEGVQQGLPTPELRLQDDSHSCTNDQRALELQQIESSDLDCPLSSQKAEHDEQPKFCCEAEPSSPGHSAKQKKSKKRKKRPKALEVIQEAKTGDDGNIPASIAPAVSSTSGCVVPVLRQSEAQDEDANLVALEASCAAKCNVSVQESGALEENSLVLGNANETLQDDASSPEGEHPRAEAWRSIFRRLMDDGQLHTESLPLALQLAGFPIPNAEWVQDVLKALTPYAALDVNEFVSFVLKYEEREHGEARVLFRRFDDNGNGRMEIGELTGVFESCGITAVGHAISEIVNEVGAADPSCLTFDEFWQVMLHLRVNEGFTKSEVRDIHDMFAKFDVRHTGALEAHELARVLCYMGYAMDAKTIHDIVRELEVDEHGSVDEREFFACMRKIREREVETMKKVFKDCDKDCSGGISVDELLVVLRTLGYFPELDDSLRDAACDAGIDLCGEMTFDQLWLFLEAYRRREGFSRAEVEELRASFDQADTVKDGELDAFEVCQLFVRLGLPVSRTQVERFVTNADIDGSGTINFEEYLKVFRQWRHHLSCKARRAYVEKCPTDQETLRMLVPWASQSDLEYSGSRVADINPDSEFKFVSLVTELQKLSRHQVRDNHGFGEPELEVLKVHFGMFDTARKGYLSDREVQQLLETVCGELATSAALRPQLLEIMKEATRHAGGAMDFSAFLVLMRRIKELSELDKIRKEREAIRKVGFTDQQVLEFRELFMGNIDRESLSFDEVKDMLSNVIPMSGKNCDAIEQMLLEVATKSAGERTVDFSGFLLLLRRMMDLNVASINDCAEKACAGLSELSSRDSSPPKRSARSSRSSSPSKTPSRRPSRRRPSRRRPGIDLL